MLVKTALRMMVHEAPRYSGAVFGVSLALFLVLLQSGFYFGFKRDITVVQDSFAADLWVVPKALLTFEYAPHFDDAAYWKVLSVPGVSRASRVVFDWSKWRIPATGAKENVLVLGTDFASGIAFDLGKSYPGVEALLRPDGHVLVDEKDAAKLGVERDGRDAEMQGHRVKVVGFVRGKKLFTTACLVVTDLANAQRLLDMRPQHVSFIALNCCPGTQARQVAQRLRLAVPEHSVMTGRELHDLTQRYWESRTGIGPILFLSAGLAALTGFLTVLLTFYLLTVQKLPVFAAMKALGASAGEIAALMALQVGLVFAAGAALAAVAVALALGALGRTHISVVITTSTWLTVFGIIALACALACLPSVWKIRRLEPAEAFRA